MGVSAKEVANTCRFYPFVSIFCKYKLAKRARQSSAVLAYSESSHHTSLTTPYMAIGWAFPASLQVGRKGF
jgi:hypothetical protein